MSHTPEGAESPLKIDLTPTRLGSRVADATLLNITRGFDMAKRVDDDTFEVRMRVVQYLSVTVEASSAAQAEEVAAHPAAWLDESDRELVDWEVAR